MSTIVSQIANACYLAIALHFVRRIVSKPLEDPVLDAIKNLPDEARMKIYSDAYSNPECALVGYKEKRGFKGRVIDTGLVIMPYIPNSQEQKEQQKLTDEPLMFIPPEDILNDTDIRPGY